MTTTQIDAFHDAQSVPGEGMADTALNHEEPSRIRNEPVRSYQIMKKILPTGGSTSTPSPTYHAFASYLHKVWLPPSFKLHPGAVSDGEEGKRCISAVTYQSWWGMVTAKIKIKRFDPLGNPKPALVVQREGGHREYHFTLPSAGDDDAGEVDADGNSPKPRDLVWKGTKAGLKRAYIDAGEKVPNSLPNGNLKLYLTSDPSRLLGIWKNTTSMSLLGNLWLYDDFQEGKGLEDIITICFAIVLYERLTGRGWGGNCFGGSEKEVNLATEAHME